MSDRPKPKSNAILKNLPEDRQAQIADWCNKPNDRDEDGKVVPKSGGLAYAQAQLAADGLSVSLPTLAEFLKWWELEQDLKMSFAVADQVLAATGNILEARKAGENLLLRLGIARQDPKLILAGAKTSDARRGLDLMEETGRVKARQGDAKIKQKDRDLQLAERRVRLLEENAEKAKQALTAIVSKGGLSPETLQQIEEAAKIL